jgi:hypothetical protein
MGDDGVGAARARSRALTAEWAAWGRRPDGSGSDVLACSDGHLKASDFANLIGRYAIGTPDRLPQYSVSWLPRNGNPEYIAIALHGPAPGGAGAPAADGRYQSAGWEAQAIRLFCFRYTDLTTGPVPYSDLLAALRDQPLPPATGTAVPLVIEARPDPLPAPSPEIRAQARQVAALLLSSHPVCVLNAEAVTAAERLAFIDLVMAQLPYGLRAAFSAATWASPTASNLKFRLYFANAERDDGLTYAVTWGRPESARLPERGGRQAVQYLNWLEQAGPSVEELLAGRDTPTRFTAPDIQRLVLGLPPEQDIEQNLRDLADGLRRGDLESVQAITVRLSRQMSSKKAAANRTTYRKLIFDRGLLRVHRDLSQYAQAEVYRVLLKLGFDSPVSYASYCAIEDEVGGPPQGALGAVMQRLVYDTLVPLLLIAKAVGDLDDGQMADALAQQHVPATSVLDEVERDAASLRPAHRAVAYDFAVSYLRGVADNPGRELTRRGYLADILATLFPGDLDMQQSRLEDNLRLVYGQQLTKAQIRVLFGHPRVSATPALEAAVASLAVDAPGIDRLIKRLAAAARPPGA